MPTPDPRDAAIEQLKNVLTEVTKKVEEQDKILKDLAEPPGMLANLTHILPADGKNPERLVIDGRIFVLRPKTLEKEQLELGCTLHVGKYTMRSDRQDRDARLSHGDHESK